MKKGQPRRAHTLKKRNNYKSGKSLQDRSKYDANGKRKDQDVRDG